MSFIQKQPERNGCVSIHIATSIHIPGKKYPSQIREYLGVLNQENNELLLSRKASEPDATVLKLLKGKGICYNGRRADSRGPKPRHAEQILKTEVGLTTGSSCHIGIMETGRRDALRILAEGSGLSKSLCIAFGETDGSRLLSLAMHQVSEGEALYLAESWMEDSGVETTGMTSSSVCRLMSEIGNDQIGQQKFFSTWIKACGMPKPLIHDTTSISTYSDNLESAEWGHNRDCEASPQVNLALVVAQESRRPLWFRIIPGSIPDVTTLKITSQMLQELGLECFSYSLDSGYFSSSNIAEMLKYSLEFTIGVPLGNKQAKTLLKKHYNALRSLKRSFLYGDERFRYIECQFIAKMSDGSLKSLPAYLYLSPERQEQSLKGIETSILNLEKKAQDIVFKDRHEATTWIRENAGALIPYLAIHTKNEKIEIKHKSNSIAKIANKLGITLIISTDANASKEKVMSNYRARDIAEKVFDAYKNATGNNRLRSGNDQSSQGRVFLGFISVVLRSLFEQKLRESYSIKHYSVQQALSLLRKVKKLKLKSGKEIMVEVPKKVREVAIAFGVPIE